MVISVSRNEQPAARNDRDRRAPGGGLGERVVGEYDERGGFAGPQPPGPAGHPAGDRRGAGGGPQRALAAEPGLRESLELARVRAGTGAGVAEVGAVDERHASVVQGAG